MPFFRKGVVLKVFSVMEQYGSFLSKLPPSFEENNIPNNGIQKSLETLNQYMQFCNDISDFAIFGIFSSIF